MRESVGKRVEERREARKERASPLSTFISEQLFRNLSLLDQNVHVLLIPHYVDLTHSSFLKDLFAKATQLVRRSLHTPLLINNDQVHRLPRRHG